MDIAKKVSDGRRPEEGRKKIKAAVIGHVHMAKTGGTTLNGILALNYEKVCGHKGYSLDYFQANQRFNNTSQGWMKVEDAYSAQHARYNRGRVHPQIMDEIGYEDCDYISMEANFGWWQRFDKWPRAVELHVPCRESIDYLMSQCNMRGHVFDCNAQDLAEEVKKCLVAPDRFSFELANKTLHPNFSVKCFDFKHSFTKYISHIGNVISKKSITSEYFHRDTNKKRNKSRECVRENHEVRSKTIEILENSYDYYSFCKSCLGSKSDLLFFG